MSVLERPALQRAPEGSAAAEPARFPWLLGLLGTLATTLLVLAAGRSTMPLGVVVKPSFGGVLAPAPSGGTVSAIVVLLALASLVGCWWRVLELSGRGSLRLRTVAGLGALWVLPVLLAPPLLSLDAFAYLAQGRMLTVGLDPYAGGPVLLGQDPVGSRVDPMWRANPAPYGPLALVLFRVVAATGGDLTQGVLLLRLAALAGIAVAVAVAVHLASPRRRPAVLAVGLLNPITIVHLIGGVHIDAVLAGVVGLALLALHYRRMASAVLLVGAAVAVKVTALPLLPFALLVLRRRGARWHEVVGAGLAALVIPLALTRPLVARPWAFVEALVTSGSSHVWYSPATLVGGLVHSGSAFAGLPFSAGASALVGTLLSLGAGTVAVLLLLRAQWRSPELSGVVLRAAAAVLIASLCLPAIYPWYLAGAVFVLASTSNRSVQRVIVVLSTALSFAALPPLRSSAWLPLTVTGMVVVLALSLRARDALRREGSFTSDLRWLWHPSDLRHTARGHDRRRHEHRSGTWRRTGVRTGLALTTGAAVLLGGAALAYSDEPVAPPTPAALKAPERQLLVTAVSQGWPDHHIVSLRPLSPGSYEVELVQPGVARCEMRLERVAGPDAGWLRLSTPPHGTVRAEVELACPYADPS